MLKEFTDELVSYFDTIGMLITDIKFLYSCEQTLFNLHTMGSKYPKMLSGNTEAVLMLQMITTPKENNMEGVSIDSLLEDAPLDKFGLRLATSSVDCNIGNNIQFVFDFQIIPNYSLKVKK